MKRGIVSVRRNIPRVNVIAGKVRVSLAKTRATAASGKPVYYDSGNHYDDGKYYDRWYSEDGIVAQVDEPKMTVKDKTAKINTKERKPKIKVKYNGQ
jgi:hypothetical protein